MKAASLPGFLQGETSEGDITGRFAGKGKLTFWKVLEDLTQTMTKYRHFYSYKWHNDHLKQPLVPLKHFLSVIFASHRFEECSRCKVVAFQEERGTIPGSSPPKAAILPAIMRAHYQAMIEYNTISALIKRLFLMMHAKRKIQYKKLKTIKKKWIPENANRTIQNWKGHDNMDINIIFNWVLKVSKHEASLFIFGRLFHLVQTHRRPVSWSKEPQGRCSCWNV